MAITKNGTIAAYIKGFPKDIQVILKKIQQTVRAAAPQAEEGISYGMPVFKQQGNLVYFAAFKKHIGFYPPVNGLAKERKPYANPKGNLQFPYDKPMPYGLMTKITKLRLKENMAKAKAKAKAAKKK